MTTEQDRSVSELSATPDSSSTPTPKPKRTKKAAPPSFAETASNFEDHRKRVVDGAYHLHALGLSIFYIPLKEKTPKHKDSWKALMKTRILVEDIPTLFAEPGNVAVIAGKLSGVTILDVDGTIGWNHLKDKLGLTYENLAHVPHVRTNGDKADSYHFYFKYSEKHYTTIGSKSKILKVDVRSEGGYAIAPPSIHPKTGRAYEWITPITAVEDLPDMDSEWEAVLFPKRTDNEYARHISENSREDSTFFGNPIYDNPTTLGARMSDILKHYWVEGSRHALNLYLVGFLRKCKLTAEQVHGIIEEICKCCGDHEVQDRLNAITTTYEKPENEIKGSSGLDEIMNCDDLQDLRKLFVFSHHSPLHKAGFDSRGIYKIVTTKEETYNVHVLHGRVEFNYCKDVHRHSEGIRDTRYVFTINEKPFEVRPADLADPRKKLYTQMCDQKIAVSLADIGVVSELLNSCISTLDYPTYNYYTHMGWIGDDLVVPNLARRDNILENQHLFRGWNDARGSMDTLAKCYKPELVKKFPPLFCAIGQAVISPFLQLLRKHIPRIRNGFLNLVGRAGKGKSSIGRVAVAFWGDPEAIKMHWHSTINSLEYQLRKNDVFPVFLDELSTAGEKFNFQQFIYMTEQGLGKGRSKWDSAVGDTDEAQRKGWCLNVISTGEESIKQNARQGVDARVIELDVDHPGIDKVQRYINDLMGYRLARGDKDTPWTDADLTKEAPEFVINVDKAGHNYGWGMRALLKHLERPNGKQDIVNLLLRAYEAVERDLIERHKRVQNPGVNDRLITNWTCIALGYLLCHKLMGFKEQCTVSFLGDLVESCWAFNHAGAPACNDPEHIYQTYCSYYYSHRDMFAKSTTEFLKNREVAYVGFTETEGDKSYFCFPLDVARKVEKDAGIKATSVQQDRLIADGKMMTNEPARRAYKIYGTHIRFFKILIEDKSTEAGQGELNIKPTDKLPKDIM